MARVEGFEPAQSGQQPVDINGDPVAVGVWGDSTTGAGVLGTNGVLPPDVANIATNIAGVEGHSVQNPGVYGASVEDAGVRGESLQSQGMLGRSVNGSGMLGVTFTPTVPGQPPAAHGVFGVSTAGGNGVTGFVGDATGVVGNSVRGVGVRGVSGASHGVVGESVGGREGPASGTGVIGRSDAGLGVFGRSNSGVGVRGESSSNSSIVGVTFGTGHGAFGLHFSQGTGSGLFGQSVLRNGVEGHSFSGFGVRGEGRNGGVHGFSTSSAANAGGIVGENPNGFAGLFLGKVRVTGFLSKSGGGFEIDHPLDPANQYLRHSFVECPEMLNVYSGNVTTDDKGEARVNLPKYFEALNQDFRYQLTVIGQFAQAIVAQEIRKNQFTIKTDQPRVKVSWQVSGTRRDPWAAANRIAVEEEKAADEKGRYLHPELWRQSEEATIHRSAQGEDPLRAVGQLMPDELRQRVERHLGALQRGDQVDHDGLRSLVGEARRLAELRPREEPARIDPTRLEAEWRRVEELVRRMGPTPPSREADAARLRQIGQLMPEPVRELVERRLQALQQGEHLGPEELRSLVVEARQQADLPGRDEPPRIDEARLQDDWRQVQELVRRKPGGASDRTGRTRGSPKA